jgi:predicted transcriptional regulator of viral defense system
MSPWGIDMVGILRRHRPRLFTTSDFRTLTGVSPTAATQALRRLAMRRLVLKIKRGVWINGLESDINAFEAVPFLTAPWPSYVSLYSALSQYGIVAEIPHLVYGVTSGPPAKYRTPIGDFSLHHLSPRLIWGYETRREGDATYLIAEREKAFLDLVYLALIPRSPLRMPRRRESRWDLNAVKLKKYVARFKFPPLRSALCEMGALKY